MYIDIGNKSATQQTGKWRKDTKDNEATFFHFESGPWY